MELTNDELIAMLNAVEINVAAQEQEIEYLAEKIMIYEVTLRKISKTYGTDKLRGVRVLARNTLKRFGVY